MEDNTMVIVDAKPQHPPKIVHQIWFQFDTYLSKEHETLIERNRQMAISEGFDYILWDRESAETLLKTHYPYLLSFLVAHSDFNIVKCDFFRYLVMYHYGGIYLDLDFYVLNSFTEIYHSLFGEDDERVNCYELLGTGDGTLVRSDLRTIPKSTSIVLTEEWYDSINHQVLNDEKKGSLHNGFLMSIEHDAFWWGLVCDIYANHRDVRVRDDVWKVSGTLKLRRAYISHCLNYNPLSSKIVYLPYYYTCPYKCIPKAQPNMTMLCRSEQTIPMCLNDSCWSFLTLPEVENEHVKALLTTSITACLYLEGGSLWIKK